MAKYRVTVKSFINNTIIDPETMPVDACVVDYDGKPGSNLELVEDDKPKGRKSKDDEGQA